MPTPYSRRLWMLAVLAIIVSATFWPSTAVLLAQWSDFVNITFTHGWLILAVCIWLVARAGPDIRLAPARPWALAQLVLIAGVLAWMVSFRASIQDLHVTIFPALFWLAAAAAFGWRVARLLIFPVGFFVFALPSWAQLGNPLQELTVLAMRLLLGMTGPAAEIRGDLIHIPNGSFRIEEGCSGLHFMIVGLAVAALHGELRRDSIRLRIAGLVLMAVLALLANWVRVYVIIQAGYLTDMRSYLVSVSHYWFGWGVFAVALVVFFWVANRWPSQMPATRLETEVVSDVARANDVRGFVVAVVLVVALPLISVLVRAVRPPAPLSDVPFVVLSAPWFAAPPGSDSSWWPEFAGADDTEYLQVEKPGTAPVEVFRARYRQQRQGAELVGGTSSLLGPQLRWRGEQRQSTPAGIFGETEAADAKEHRSLIWWRYQIGDRSFTRALPCQLWYGLTATLSSPQSSLIALRANCQGDCAGARRQLNELVTTGALR
jgi:exosortase